MNVQQPISARTDQWVMVGLGPKCTTKYQIKRWLAARGNPPDLARFRSVFDMQGTPVAAMLEYFRRDFTGMLVLEDLAPGLKTVLNRRYFTSHGHQFGKNITASKMAELYPAVFARHEKRCADMRQLLSGSLHLAFVIDQPLKDDELREFFLLLDARKPYGANRIICVDNSSSTPLDGAMKWKGDDEFWNKALDAGMSSAKRVFHYPQRPNR